MAFKHHDEARNDSVMALMAWLKDHPESRAVFIDDLFGKYRIVLWPENGMAAENSEHIKRLMAEAAGSYWSGDVWVVTAETSKLDQQVYDAAWEEGGAHPDEPRLRILERVRNRVAWFGELADPPWEFRGDADRKGPPIVVFYSFKGGVGRTTALASFAIQRAQAGERVVVIDGDLDAPGVGPLFAPGAATRPEIGARPDEEEREGTPIEAVGAQWGVVDYLLEAPSPGEVELSEYYQSVRSEELVPGDGEILVFPAGRIDENYLAKLARLDFDPARKGAGNPWTGLLQRIREDLNPHWILMDSRAGLGEPAGLLLGGMAHLHVLVGTASEQSWQGIRLILDRIGSGRVRRNKPQSECVLVQAMIPEFEEAAVDAQTVFLARAENEFVARYYAEDPEDPEDDSMWFVRDMPVKDAPHKPVCLSYKQKLAYFRSLEHVLTALLSDDYKKLAERIQGRFVEEPE